MLAALVTIAIILIIAWAAISILRLIPVPIVAWFKEIIIICIYACAAIGILWQIVPLLGGLFRMLTAGHL